MTDANLIAKVQLLEERLAVAEETLRLQQQQLDQAVGLAALVHDLKQTANLLESQIARLSRRSDNPN